MGIYLLILSNILRQNLFVILQDSGSEYGMDDDDALSDWNLSKLFKYVYELCKWAHLLINTWLHKEGTMVPNILFFGSGILTPQYIWLNIFVIAFKQLCCFKWPKKKKKNEISIVFSLISIN